MDLVEEKEGIDQILVIDSLDALFDVDVTDFFFFQKLKML